MKVAIMQPYFFPYIGYWQLIHASDCFVLFDDVQYIRKGWINRNRILKHGGGVQYFGFPVKKHSRAELIKNVFVKSDADWETLILGQIEHYKKKAPFYNEVHELMREILCNVGVVNVTRLNYLIIKRISECLGMKRKLIVSSEQNFDYGGVHEAGDWALRITEQMNAREYINPASGAGLFNEAKFSASNIKLSFLVTGEVKYPQLNGFEPSLSIIDVMMFKGIGGVGEFLENYKSGPLKDE